MRGVTRAGTQGGSVTVTVREGSQATPVDRAQCPERGPLALTRHPGTCRWHQSRHVTTMLSTQAPGTSVPGEEKCFLLEEHLWLLQACLTGTEQPPRPHPPLRS